MAPSGANRGGFDGQFEGIEDAACVAVGNIDQMRQSVGSQGHPQFAVAALGIGERLAGDG